MVRPRRAVRPPLIVRIARIGIPGVVAAALATGVAVAYWPKPEPVTAEPPIPSAASPLTGTREERPDRSKGRPSIPPTKSAEDKAKEEAAKKEAAKKAAAKKAAAEKAKKEAAAKKAQEEKEADGDSEGAGSQKSEGDGSGDKKESGTTGGSEEKSGDSDKESEQETYRAPTDWEVVGDRYVTTALNLRVEPSTDGKIVKVLPEGEKVKATSTKEGDYTLVIYSDDPRWLATEYLSKSKPEPRDDGDSSGGDGFSMEPCPSGSKVENGLTEDAIRVHRAICHKFPSIDSYGGVRSAAYGYHGSGRALDAMVDGELGWEVARWVRANAKKLGVMEVIYSQKIWTVQRSSEGWRSMSDRGSATANHYDHVHVSVYGDAGTG